MRNPIVLFIFLLQAITPSFLLAQPPEQYKGAKPYKYKTVGDTELYLYVFSPEGHQPSDSRPAAVFFFGGSWNGGTPAQFVPHSRHLISRGMISVVAD